MAETPTREAQGEARIAVIGAGWWAQGWHLPHLAANAPSVKIAAIVDANSNPVSTLASSPLLSLEELSQKYGCPHYKSMDDLLSDPEVGPTIDGAIVATSHASHYAVGTALLREGIHRRKMAEGIEKEEEGVNKKPRHAQVLHRNMSILMEKPMTTSVDEAKKLWEMRAFVINHTASYRPQTKVAQQIITTNQIGRIRHISASMNGPLMWLFDDPKNEAWVSKTPSMNGNGYAWGQLAHVLAWTYNVLGAGSTEEVATPTKVYCNMSHAPNTGADVSLAAVITCKDGITFSLDGTALLPGSQYADPPIGKHIRVEMFGTKGSLMYKGDDKKPETGRLELRRVVEGKDDGKSEYPCENMKGVDDGFYFEDGDPLGTGPGSMNAFLDACRASSQRFEQSLAGHIDESIDETSVVNDSLVGLRTVQIIDAMYRSSLSGLPELIEN
ncbi:hypothetical protein ACHAWO_003219 [Cyclotella atomus]|uniref:Gfo/Idh/MocA-like oxidoreductase N-terminal domain-containing protein n=1 Tax=Cyclotella atomus TaxID=382360 RepID=A0ABD3P8W3_9STRA